MSGSKEIRADRHSKIKQEPEFDKLIAVDAGVRSFTAQVFIDEVVLNNSEMVTEIGDIQRDTKKIRDRFSVNAVKVIKEPHSHADDIKVVK